ncbi:E3 ubiquitin-protein ligase RNF126 isoform X7 [Manis pentadactyla]|uniref:E3 ubiquitin-protein ligase RNF126 isoform X7 n=1 Tax=Manis pentadactyla TaxID=143292 RepID=UPI00255CE0B3|nr:E3 ubiquitin-protein ligase RNF126 isoform X7 [Manis pentadactyla]
MRERTRARRPAREQQKTSGGRRAGGWSRWRWPWPRRRRSPDATSATAAQWRSCRACRWETEACIQEVSFEQRPDCREGATRITYAQDVSLASLRSSQRHPAGRSHRRHCALAGAQRTAPPPPRPPRTRAGSPSRMWTSTCSHCRRAMGSLLSASLTTASRSPRSPPGRRPKRAGTPRAGGTGSSTPGTGTAPGSRALASLRGGPLAGTKASPRSKGSSSSWSTASSLLPPSPAWAWAPGASCTQTRWTMPGGPTAWTPSSRSFSISLKTRAPRLQTRRKSRPSPPSLSPRSTWALGLSALCARTTMHWASMCGSCPATTSSTTAASCPGWSSLHGALHDLWKDRVLAPP